MTLGIPIMIFPIKPNDLGEKRKTNQNSKTKMLKKLIKSSLKFVVQLRKLIYVILFFYIININIYFIKIYTCILKYINTI